MEHNQRIIHYYFCYLTSTLLVGKEKKKLQPYFIFLPLHIYIFMASIVHVKEQNKPIYLLLQK
jgi:hypothetical protein